ncbi:UNVERIFIED_CONTAM: hypothetical protein Sradi_7098900, partial [Sesamum radiatum]
LPTLPAHLFRKETLFAIASNIGTPLQIADSTFNQSNLSKARVCVEVDLLKPLLEEIDIKICGQTIVQRIEYEEVPRYCTLCKHLGHNDAECYSKGDALKTPRRRVKGKTAATVKEKWEAVRNEPTVDKEENHVQNDIIDEVHAENSASNAENESLNVIVEHVFVENGVNIEHEFLVEHGNVCTIANDNEKVEDDESDDNEQSCNDTFGALILRPDNFLCDLKKRTSWLKVDNALRLFDTFIKFGKVVKGFRGRQRLEVVIKGNALAIRSAILFQKCVLIFDRVSQLYLKPLDERSPPIATRTRRRKKGKNPMEPPDEVHYF